MSKQFYKKGKLHKPFYINNHITNPTKNIIKILKKKIQSNLIRICLFKHQINPKKAKFTSNPHPSTPCRASEPDSKG